jgi:hypothetical protein
MSATRRRACELFEFGSLYLLAPFSLADC